MGFINKLLGAKNDFRATNPEDVTNNNQTSNLASALVAQANGQGPSLANNQLQQGTNETIAKGAGAIGSVKGINPALAAKMIADQSATQLGNENANAAQIRSREQLASEAQLGDVLSKQNAQHIQAGLGAQQINADVAKGNAGQNASTGGGILGGIGSFLGLNKGGEVPGFIKHFASGGSVPNFGSSFAGALNRHSGTGDDDGTSSAPLFDLGGAIRGGIKSLFGGPGDDTSSGLPSAFDTATMYGAPGGAGGGSGAYSSQDYANLYGAPGANEVSNMASGGKVPGKAEVAGDSPDNDTVPALVSPGEVVLPRSKAKDPEKAKEFIEALNKAKKKKEGSGSYAHVLSAQEALHKRLSNIEKLCYGGTAS